MKLDYKEYLRTQYKVNSIDPVIVETSNGEDTESTFVDLAPALPLAELEVKLEDLGDPLETIEDPSTLHKTDNVDTEDNIKIEIVKDMILKTESSDVSAFIQEPNEYPTKGAKSNSVDADDVNESNRKEDEKEEEFTNRVTMEEFLPHQDYMA